MIEFLIFDLDDFEFEFSQLCSAFFIYLFCLFVCFWLLIKKKKPSWRNQHLHRRPNRADPFAILSPLYEAYGRRAEPTEAAGSIRIKLATKTAATGRPAPPGTSAARSPDWRLINPGATTTSTGSSRTIIRGPYSLPYAHLPVN